MTVSVRGYRTGLCARCIGTTCVGIDRKRLVCCFTLFFFDRLSRVISTSKKGRKSEKEMKVDGSRASDQFSRCVHVRGDTCECKTRASERTNERNERTAGRDTTLGGTTFRRLSREIDCNFYLLLFYWRRKRVPFSMFFFFSVSRSRQISSVYVRARAQHTRDKFFPSRTRSIVRKRKKERKERKMERRKSGKAKKEEGGGSSRRRNTIGYYWTV